MIVIIILALVVIGGVVAAVLVARSKSAESSAPERSAPAAPRARPAPLAEAPSVPASDPFDESLERALAPEPAEVIEPTPAVAATSSAPKPQVNKKVKKVAPAPAAPADDESALGRFSATPAAKPSSAPAPAKAAAFRYPMESSPAPAIGRDEPVPPPAPAETRIEKAVEKTNVVVAFDLDRVVVAPLTDGSDAALVDDEPDSGGATVTRLEPRVDEPLDLPLAELVAELIDAADPEVAEVMARLIDASDPDLVAQLVDADDLAVAEVVAKLVDSADPEVRALVVELADAPDRRQVAEVLRLVDADYANDAVGVALPADIAEKLDELDIESDLELTSRPGEMAQFARLDNSDQLRVIIRVLCGLVAREDLPRSPRMPSDPASAAEGRRWPLSRARWPVPPPDDEEIIKRAPLPARRTSTKAS